MDRKCIEVVKFLLDWHYLLTEPPVEGSIPEIYFCFVCSVYSKGKDKVSWLQFMKYLKNIDKLCNGNTLVCVPKNALEQRYEDPFRCFDKIVYVNRLSLALLLRTSQSLTSTYSNYSPPSSAGSEHNGRSEYSSQSCDSSSSPSAKGSLKLSTLSNTKDRHSPPLSFLSSSSLQESPMKLDSSATSSNAEPRNETLPSSLSSAPSRENFDVLKNIQFAYERKSIDNAKYEIPVDKKEKLKYVLDLIEGETPIVSENDIYPIKLITNKKLIPRDINDTYTLTTRSNRLEQLEHLLNTPCSSHYLQRERARSRTSVHPFYDCCEDSGHASLLTTLTSFDKNTSYCKLNEDKLRKLIYEHHNPNENNNNKNSNKQVLGESYLQLSKCIENNLHFIPIIQQQTDLKLGDCSYLDTCHKMATCRYIHYGQLMPLEFKVDKTQSRQSARDGNTGGELGNDFDEEIFQINEHKRVGDFTRGESTCGYLKCELPAQWINCDLMKLNFDVLGNDFGVVIADPSWTIHMNLNYSSMKDEELLSLKMDKLQTEGIFLLWVTGRTIETGREFLNKWGYKVINQITWIKTSQLIRTISTGRTGHWLNHSKEHMLVGVKGNPKWINKGIDAQILISSTRETSRKPDEIYGMVDRLTADSGVRKLEIFGRQHNTRPGWLTVGNQLEGVRLIEKSLINRYQESIDQRENMVC